MLNVAAMNLSQRVTKPYTCAKLGPRPLVPVRFTIRTGLLAIAVVGLLMGLVVKLWGPTLHNSFVRRRWDAAGATVLFNKQDRLYLLLASDKPGEFAPASLSELAGSEDLEILWLVGTSCADSDMHYLCGFPKLFCLVLNDTEITDRAAAELARITTLRYLHLKGTSVSDASIEHLGAMKGLKELHVDGSRISPTGITTLSKLLPDTSINSTLPTSAIPRPATTISADAVEQSKQ